ncbi:hypothetical protein JRO89_XS07G0154200 [Xanthoceras sorbifolium]|uniref:F-box/kelch-repeat protein n=1 Tax=Xanthoceras sorbifolium TaxID=99658 RepID=A0ABQ8HU74_9ROSI|nr:hypothetical protein JRO89_XS07G0154200 [Xanthoceras sorbifolium]
MGGLLSLAGPKCRTRDYIETSQNESCKKRKMSLIFDEEGPRLIPSLPDELSIQILARLPRICYFNLRLKTIDFCGMLWILCQENGRGCLHFPVLFMKKNLGAAHLGLDVEHGGPKLQNCRHSKGLAGWKDTSDPMPILRLRHWCCRAYSKTGILNNKLYVVGGVSRGQGGLNPLQSAEVFDPYTGAWSEVPSMPFSRAQVLPNPFLADMLKPIATGTTSYMGRLCVPQKGWPARQAGTKLSVVVDGELYAFDPSSSLDSGKIKVYDQKEDAWKVVIGKVPICDFTDSESPYLLAGFHGKLHVITKDANHNIAVLRADLRDNLSSMSSSSTSLSADSVDEHSDTVTELDTVVWKAISSKDFGSAELVSCQVIDI